jgi:small conductance mechanosensitive channel
LAGELGANGGRRVLAQVELDPEEIEPAVDTLVELYRQLLSSLPLVAIALVLAVVGIIAATTTARLVQRGLGRTQADRMAIGLVGRLVRIALILATLLLALAVAGVEVGPALAGLGIAGIAVALALQGILENFFAGIILLVRKPFRAGDQILTNELEGTVEDIDLRVTRLLSYDGEQVLVPNISVFQSPMVNFTTRGRRRSSVIVGIDYRDDHDAAREVIRAAVEGVEGVFGDPPPEVWLRELGDSSVDFEVVYWSDPYKLQVRRTQDRVLAAVKRGIEDAGMTIPWPIRTLALDAPLRLQRDEARADS